MSGTLTRSYDIVNAKYNDGQGRRFEHLHTLTVDRPIGISGPSQAETYTKLRVRDNAPIPHVTLAFGDGLGVASSDGLIVHRRIGQRGRHRVAAVHLQPFVHDSAQLPVHRRFVIAVTARADDTGGSVSSVLLR